MTLPTIFALGSCRLVGPITNLHNSGLITFTNSEACWYTHNSKEVLQRLEFMTGEIELPDMVKRLTMDLDSCKTPHDKATSQSIEADIGVFEISTRIVKKHADYVLHSTLLAKQEFRDYEDKLDSFDELEDDLLKLKSRYNGLIIGCNIVLNDAMDENNIHRQLLNEHLQAFAAKNVGIEAVDPNSIINRNAPTTCLEDNNHFLPSFVAQVAALYKVAIDKLSPVQTV